MAHLVALAGALVVRPIALGISNSAKKAEEFNAGAGGRG
jgi:hypothetical protein